MTTVETERRREAAAGSGPGLGGGKRYVRVRTDVAALPKLFDYAVPDDWTDEVTVGTRVRVNLHGRRVGGWVVEVDVTPPAGVEPLPLKGWSGFGPPAPVLSLAEWAAWRWAGPVSFFLGVASPVRPVRRLPGSRAGSAGGAGGAAGAAAAAAGAAAAAAGAAAPAGAAGAAARAGGVGGTADTAGVVAGLDAMAARAVGRGGGGGGGGGGGESTLLRIPPTTDLLELVLAVVNAPEIVARPGGVLVLVPAVGWAERLCGRLVRRGYRATTDWAEARAGWPIVLGSRAAAWAPMPELSAALILDAHDEAYREESAPTYSAVDVVTERARQAGIPSILTSPVPPTVVASGRRIEILPAPLERAGWSTVEAVDRRGADPRSGMFSEEFVRLARSVLDDPALISRRGPLVCFYDRTGRARLLACANCGELAQCTTCGAAVAQEGSGLRCPRCHSERPMICAACGRLRMKTLRAGVSRLREELAALLGVEVGEVSGRSTGDVPVTPVLIGTEAVLHRVRRAAAVAFLDIDLHLLAPRFSATDEAMALLIRASRLVGPRQQGPASSRILVQTRVPDHPVVKAARLGDPSEVVASEEAMRRSARLPPFTALAAVTGSLAAEYVDAVRLASAGGDSGAGGGDGDVAFSEMADGGYLVQAPDHTVLCDLLGAVPRPAGRGLRVAVDPVAI